MVQLAPSNDDFLSLHYTLEMQTKWYYLVQFSKKMHEEICFDKKIKVKRPKERPQGQNLSMLQRAQFFSWSIYASHTTFPSNFGVSIGAFWYFFQNWPKSLHKIVFLFSPL